MRGDTVGVGDVGEVQGRTRGWRYASSGDDGRADGRERDRGMVCRGAWPEHHSQGQRCWDGIDIDDCVRGEHGAGVVYRSCETGADRMRGDALAVGDVGQVHDRTRGSRISFGDDDWVSGIQGRERESGMVIRPRVDEHHAQGQPCWDGIDIGDGAWGEHGAGVKHLSCETGADRMRGDTVAVGDVGQVHDRARGSRHASPCDDGRGAGGECESGMVIRPRVDEHRAHGQPCWDGIDIGDGEWGEHRAYLVHGPGETWAHGMRGDTVGVGDVGEVQGRTRGWRYAAGSGDGR